MRNSVKLQAHKGVETEYPENTLPAFTAAGEQGYEMIELDLRMTKDNKIIVMHDSAINTTGRNPDGSEIEQKIRIYDITYEEALQYDFGIWFSEEFRGTKLPLFEEVLPIAKKYGITLKIDNKLKRFTEEQLEILRKGFQEHDFTQAVPISPTYEDMTPKQAKAFVALKKRIRRWVSVLLRYKKTWILSATPARS